MVQNGILSIFIFLGVVRKATTKFRVCFSLLRNGSEQNSDMVFFFSENGNPSFLKCAYVPSCPYIIYFLHDLRSTGAGWVGALWACCTAGRTTRRTCVRNTGCPRAPPTNGGTSTQIQQRNGEHFSSLPSLLRIRTRIRMFLRLLDWIH